MIDVATMNQNRKRVLEVIRTLSMTSEFVRLDDVARGAEVSYRTVQRAVDELESQKKLKRIKRTKWLGVKYEVLSENT